MGFFDTGWGQAAAFGAGPVAGVGNMLRVKKKNDIADIDAQMQFGGPPADLNPEDFKQYMEGPGFQAMRSEALAAPGQSPYAQYALQQQSGRESMLSDQAAKQSAGQQGMAMSRLAQSGGLSSGARERLASQGLQSGTQAMADVGRQGMDTRASIGMDAEKQRQAQLAKFGGMEQTAGNLYAGIRQGNQNMANERYGNQLQANAALQASKPKGLLGMGFLGL